MRPANTGNSSIIAIVLLASAISLTAQPASPPRFADVVIRGGKVITVDPADRIASAVAVIGDRIAVVGAPADVNVWIGPNTQVIELNGRALLPGFIDAHSHVLGLAESEHLKIPIQIPPRKDVAAILVALRQKQAQLPPGAWLFGQGTYYQPMPTREQLDDEFPGNPVVLWWSAHDQIISHQASMALGLTKNAPDPAGRGQYERTATGEVKIVHDASVDYPVPQFTFAQAKEGLRETLTDFYLKKGVTTVTDMSDPVPAYRAYEELRTEGKLPVRLTLNYIIRADTPEGSGKPIRVSSLLNSLIASGLRTGFGDDWIRIGAIKIILDGVWGTTAATYKPFWKGSKTNWSPDNLGGVTFTQDELNRAVLDAHRAGWQIMVHALGDRAQDMVLTAFEAAQKISPRADARLRIEHVGHAWVDDPGRLPERVARMKQDGVIPSPQVSMLWRYSAADLEEPGVKFFPLRTIINLGFQPPNGADTLGTQNFATDPLFALARAVRRDTKYGIVVHPEEAISPMDAIRMFTTWAARAGFLESSRGSIEVGKLADLVVLSADPLSTPPANFADLAVDMTILGGKIAYQRQ
jgi:predicted amidohydrolase YtcJ